MSFHLWHRWEVWSPETTVDMIDGTIRLVQRRLCRVCRKEEIRWIA